MSTKIILEGIHYSAKIIDSFSLYLFVYCFWLDLDGAIRFMVWVKTNTFQLLGLVTMRNSNTLRIIGFNSRLEVSSTLLLTLIIILSILFDSIIHFIASFSLIPASKKNENWLYLSWCIHMFIDYKMIKLLSFILSYGLCRLIL